MGDMATEALEKRRASLFGTDDLDADQPVAQPPRQDESNDDEEAEQPTPTRRPRRRRNSFNKFAEELMRHRMELNEEIVKESRIKDGCEKLIKALPQQKKRRKKGGPSDLEVMLSFSNAKLAALHQQLSRLNKSVLQTAHKSTMYRTLRNTGWRARSVYRKLDEELPEDTCLPFVVLGSKASDPLPIKDVFRSFLSHHYLEHESCLEDEITKVDELRTAMMTAEPTKEGIRCCVDYYQQLVHCESRFFRDGQNPDLVFNWYDSMTGQVVMDRHISLEKACAIFNAATIASQVAATQDHNTEAGLQTAVYCFELAAGGFEFVRSTYHDEASPDLSAPCLEILQNLMLAQAQECIWRLYIGTEGNRCDDHAPAAPDSQHTEPPTSSKQPQKQQNRQKKGWVPRAGEAAAVAEQYQVVHDELRKQELADIMPKEWVKMVEVKKIAFFSIADVQTAVRLAKKEETRVVARAHLMRAQDNFLRCWRECSHGLPDVPILGRMIHAEAAITKSVVRQLGFHTFEEGAPPEDPPFAVGEAIRWSCSHFSQLSQLCPDPFESLGQLYFFNALCALTNRREVVLPQFVFSDIVLRGGSPTSIELVQLGSGAHAAGLRSGDYILTLDGADVRNEKSETIRTALKEKQRNITIEVVCNLDMQNFEELSPANDNDDDFGDELDDDFEEAAAPVRARDKENVVVFKSMKRRSELTGRHDSEVPLSTHEFQKRATIKEHDGQQGGSGSAFDRRKKRSKTLSTAQESREDQTV